MANIVPGIITRSHEVALYFAEDLLKLVNTATIDLAREFQIPLEYSQDPQDIIDMLYEDIAHMLRDGLINGIHLIISDNEMDKGTNAYKVRYHVHYRVDTRGLDISPVTDAGERRGLEFGPPLNVWHNARFALLIDWSLSAHNSYHQVRRPDYCFDWVTEANRFDTTNLICFREGQMVGDSAEIVSREERTSLEHQHDVI
jgi:hypothetical protein